MRSEFFRTEYFAVTSLNLVYPGARKAAGVMHLNLYEQVYTFPLCMWKGTYNVDLPIHGYRLLRACVFVQDGEKLNPSSPGPGLQEEENSIYK